jgi:hypothetical protein
VSPSFSTGKRSGKPGPSNRPAANKARQRNGLSIRCERRLQINDHELIIEMGAGRT